MLCEHVPFLINTCILASKLDSGVYGICLRVPNKNTARPELSREMWLQTMWYFDKCRFRRACAASFKLSNLKWCSVSSLRVITYSNDKQRLWSDCAYAQAGLSLCWSHVPLFGNLMSRLTSTAMFCVCER